MAESMTAGNTWLRDNGVTDMHLMVVCLSPQQHLIHAFLKESGPIFDIRQCLAMQEGQVPSYRILKMLHGSSRGGLFWKFLEETGALLKQHPVWAEFTQDERTASQALALLMRSCAVMFELVEERCKSYPMRLFGVISDPMLADDIIAEAEATPCLLDRFSREHVRCYSTPEALRSSDSVSILKGIAALFTGHIFSTESLHGRNSKRGRLRLTHPLSLQQLALWSMAEAQPAFVRKVLESNVTIQH